MGLIELNDLSNLAQMLAEEIRQVRAQLGNIFSLGVRMAPADRISKAHELIMRGELILAFLPELLSLRETVEEAQGRLDVFVEAQQGCKARSPT